MTAGIPRGWVSWLAALAEAAGQAHTDAMLALAVKRATADVRWVEIGRADALRRAAGAVRTASGDEVKHVVPSASRGVAAETLSRGSHVRVRQEPLLALALGAGGYALIAVKNARECPVEVLSTAAAILTGALHQIDVLARLAELSRAAHQEGARLRDELRSTVLPAGVVAASPQSRELFHELLPAVARHDGAVLIRGESGTGKEIVARQIHALSPRVARPFVKVNCGALPETLLESTLFGHERGAFTGADARHIGLFERANGGTLFLDEVAELSAAAQVRLLRVLQEGELERVGGTASIHVDVRVVAATHRPLEKLIATRRFRSDLYYRLSVLPLVLAPLRERPEDLELLAAQIVARAAAQIGRPAPAIDPGTFDRLRAHSWPGNVRELENVLTRATLLSRGGRLVLSDDLQSIEPLSPPRARVERLDSAIRRSISAALHECGGRLYGPKGAAQKLGLKPTTLQSKMKKLGVSRR